MKDEEIANLNNSLQKMIENKNTENEIKTNQNIEYLTNTLNEQILKINELTQKNSDYENQIKEKEKNLIQIENSYNLLNDKYNKDINQLTNQLHEQTTMIKGMNSDSQHESELNKKYIEQIKCGY